MGQSETTQGCGRAAFPETVWSRFVASGGDGSSPAAVDFDRLTRLYWRPVYRFIRTAAACTLEDAKDLTQDFFEELLDGEVLRKYDAEKGRFRVYLKAILRRFISHDRRDRARLKRGGGRIPVSLDLGDVEGGAPLADPQALSPEEIFDRQWADDVLRQTLDLLRTRLLDEGKEEYLRAYEAYYESSMQPPASDGYAAVAARLGIPSQRVKSMLDHVRDRIDGLLREVLSQGVSSYEDLSREMKDLLLR